jgi:DNA-binding CsgD family transcriptional regulator
MRGTEQSSIGAADGDALVAGGWGAAVQGRVTEARGSARRAAALARDRGQFAREVLYLQTAVQFGDDTVAQRLAELAKVVQGPRALVAAHYGAALADGDAAALDSVSKTYEAMGDRLTAADAAAQSCVLYRHQGLRGAALTAGTRAQRLMTACGAVSPATRAASAPTSMTGREREISVLVAHGASNKQIAEALTVSVRTVEGHLYRISAKLGLANRTELAKLVAEWAPQADGAGDTGIAQ